jgi:GNAT superfamily N-acetyltransferase
MTPPNPNITIQLWDQHHPRWPEFLQLAADQGQTRWLEFTADFHHASHVLVALQSEHIVGFLRYVIQPIGPDTGDCPPVVHNGITLTEAKVIAFAVVPTACRQGIGRGLQAATIQQARAAGCYQLRSYSGGDNKANHQLKLSMGFAVHPTDRKGDNEGAYFVLPLR